MRPARLRAALGRRRTGRDPAVRIRRDHRRRPPGNDGVGRTHRPLHHRGLSRAPRGHGPAGSGAAFNDRDQPGRACHRGRTRRRASGQRSARAAPRHSGRAQGQPRHPRPDDHHRGVARPRRLHPAARLLRRGTPARRRRDHPGQAQHERMGLLPRGAGDQRLERPGRPVQEPLRPRPQPVRVQLRLGNRGLRQPLRADRRHRDRRLHHVPLLQQRHRGDQAHRGALEPVRASSPSPTRRTPRGP